MKFGINMFPADFAMSIVELGRACEDLGFESLFVPEHTHIPKGSAPPGLGKEYSHTLDPFVALAGVAAVTRALKLGTGICLVVERDPIILAKDVASLDHLSDGRVLFGVGGGWNTAEMMNHGTKPTLRWKIMRERVLAMKQIWTEDEAEYHGEFVNFDPMWCWPKPVQKPNPPILVGGDGPRTFDRIIEYGDEWFPLGGQYTADGNYVETGGRSQAIPARRAELQVAARAAGRGTIPVSVFGVKMDEQAVEDYVTAGIDRCIFWLPPAGSDVVLPMLKRAAEVAAKFS